VRNYWHRRLLPDEKPEDIMAKLAMTKYITALDAVAFYQQWLVDPGGRWMFTMATPEGKFRNSAS
jgi:hypothetical protein